MVPTPTLTEFEQNSATVSPPKTTPDHLEEDSVFILGGPMPLWMCQGYRTRRYVSVLILTVPRVDSGFFFSSKVFVQIMTRLQQRKSKWNELEIFQVVHIHEL